MPRFCFHVRDGETTEPDSEGTEFDNLEQAVEDARIAAREILAEKILAGETVNGQAFQITMADGIVLAVVPLRSALKLHDDR